uniref:Uncharacterized protein n=1 Tax=Arundo donax TaxID=35708 RepID=A0A0A9C2B4_ARUDO
MVTPRSVCLARQSFIFAVAAERDFSRWKIRVDISLVAVLYAVCSAFFFPFSRTLLDACIVCIIIDNY